MTLLKDLIDIPRHAGAEDYVLRLTDSVGHGAADRTLDDYVVTPALADAFDQALGLVAESIGSGVSRGAFLAGSFGSGKSHFMAVLYALLEQEPSARAKAELQQVIARHDDALRDRTILPLAFHLLGAKTMEQALFDGYLRQVKTRHPDAPLPAVHKSDALFADADAMRARVGDDSFFDGLNGGATGGDDPWSAVLGTGSWNADSYVAARGADPASPERQRLTSALVDTYFSAYTQSADYVDLDTGLAAIATHAKDLGYDAAVLFLDELVLWLAFSVQDREFFRREAQKLTKLVESSTGTRAIPLISFVARQMDLRRWFADAGASGNEQDALDRAFKHQEGRFSTVVLGDDNLPFVANRRLLRPKDADATTALESAFTRIDRAPNVWDVLLDGINTDEGHRGADEKAFRLTYPFSPALVSTLRSLASVMQRERTALKVMQQILVDRRETLDVDAVIPVGDAFDYIVQGTSGQALDAQAAALFKAAARLYSEKFQPLLLQTHHVTLRQLDEEPDSVPTAYRTDDRLAKTLLLSAVAPNVPALKSLTAARLASLNHGSIVSPLPGGEGKLVLAKVRTWARDIPEIHLDGTDSNPTVRIQLSDVDHESVVERAKGEDNDGRRRELVKTLVSESLGLELGQPDIQGAYSHSIIWRGSRRQVDLVFGNVRDSSWLSDDHFVANPGTWRVIIDHPFDDQGHSTAEDLERVDALIARGVESRTLVWLPRFLSEERIRDLRRLVILNWLLEGSGERWQSHADHLNEGDRATAKSILESNRNTLRRSLEDAIQQAYGAASIRPGTLIEDDAHDRTLISLDRMFDPQQPVGATLGDAFDNLLTQAWEATYPGHPRFEPTDVEIRVPQLKAVAAHIARAVADKDKRVELEGDTNAVRRVAGPLGVGTASEMHYILGDDRFTPWNHEIEKALGRREQESGTAPTAPVTVGEMRQWIDAVTPAQGLRLEVSDLVIITWAALKQRAWTHHGSPLASVPDPGALHPNMELRTQPMPTGSEWSQAGTAAGSLFGVHANPHLTASAVADLVDRVSQAVTSRLGPAGDLVAQLERVRDRQAMSSESTRLKTAHETRALMQRLKQLRGVELVRALAGPDLSASTAAAGRSLSSADEVSRALTGFHWERLEPLVSAARGEGQRADAAAQVLSRLRQALDADEIVTGASQALARAEAEIFDWLATQEPTTSEPKHGPDEDPVTVIARGSATRVPGGEDDDLVSLLRRFLSDNKDAAVEVSWQVRE